MVNLSFTRLLSVFCELFPGEVNRMADPYRHLAAEEEPAKESKGWLWLLQTFSSVFMFVEHSVYTLADVPNREN